MLFNMETVAKASSASLGLAKVTLDTFSGYYVYLNPWRTEIREIKEAMDKDILNRHCQPY